MPNPNPQFDRQLSAIFRAEAVEHVRRIQECLAQLEGGAAAGKPLEQVFRAVHSLKGAARAVGEDEVEVVCHAAESLLAAVQRGRQPWSAPVGDALHDLASGLARALAQRPGPPGALAALVPRLARLEQGGAMDPATARDAAAAAAPPAAPAAPPPDAEQTVRVSVDLLGRLLYQAEELVAAKLHAGNQLAQLGEAVASAAALRTPPAAAGDAVRSWQRHHASLHALKTGAARAHRQLAGTVDALLEDIKKTLLLPVGAIRPFLVATVRELARSQGKEVEFRVSGDEVEMDRRLLEDLREPLVHLLRNAVAHGIETPQERLAAGKPARGLLEVGIVARAGGRVEITVADDGAGIDLQRLAEAARELQLPVPAGDDPADLLPLVFGSGVSTAPRLTQVAGRGIGLPIVRETVERLGGTIEVDSTRGQGTRFSIALTLSLATYHAVEVRVGGRSFLLPTARVERCMRLLPAELRAVGSQQTASMGGQDLPLVSLAGVLGLPGSTETAARIHCVVVRSGERRVAFAVDEVRGEQEVLAKPVDPALTRSPVVSGAGVLAAGGAAPILNVSELVRIALARGGRSPAANVAVTARPRGHRVLVAEDSITSRTLLKNILELAGYQVEVAVDGAEALQKLRAASFDLVVSDVEMPNVDGIALTQAIRRDQGLAGLPVVLVTSLASPSDRERGAEAGANAYIVKSSFDQGNLLQAIAELV